MKTKPSTNGLISIALLAAIASSGRCVILDPAADRSKLDESKLTRLTFEAAPRNTGHGLRASEAVFEVLELGGIKAQEGAGFAVPVYNAAYRVALGVVRCERFARNEEAGEPLTVSAFLSLPARIQDRYLNDLDQADRLDDEDWDFFKKPAQAGDQVQAGDKGNQKTEEASENEPPSGESDKSERGSGEAIS